MHAIHPSLHEYMHTHNKCINAGSLFTVRGLNIALTKLVLRVKCVNSPVPPAASPVPSPEPPPKVTLVVLDAGLRGPRAMLAS